MKKKVEELVERTKLTPEEIKDLMPLNDGYTYYQSFGEAVAEAQTQKFLNDPDLAVIVKCERCDGRGVFHSQWHEYEEGKSITCSQCHGTGIIPIPLAPALKEK
ncbi:hypothetical protein LCGC14_2477680 [marine sediment metagenome]|uniref:Uncharacterized protein n=1 Tax=marine sediment metagenome TaxID=412755 RepID=A0A0F9B8I5_9ZZZZ